MAAQREWGWDLDEMRSVGAMLDDQGCIYANECVPDFFRVCSLPLGANRAPAIPSPPNLS